MAGQSRRQAKPGSRSRRRLQRQAFAWWQHGVVYQVYPRSFMDSDGDGIGDLEGLLQRLDYLSWLGIDAVWLSPIYPSPMKDFGYDVSDYTGVHPMFGTLDDFDRLVAELHRRGMKLILDFVPNHTSDRHPWFLEARASRQAARRDWYIWRDPAPGGGPPNNWLSNFGGSGWEFDAATGQYYYHAFLKEQPDLNWRNPEVREAMHEVLRFWLDRGVDGFRVDVIWHLIKDGQFRDNPPNPDWNERMGPERRLLPLYTADRPEVHDVVAGMRRVLDRYGDRLLIGEIYLPFDRLVAYYGPDLSGAHLPFNFSLIDAAWDAPHICRLITEYEEHLPAGGWPNWVLGNHDKARIASRVGPAQARVAAMLLLTLRGTPTLYYGDEIGMQDVPIPPERLCDPLERNVPGLGLGRDPQRTPMQWDGSAGAGFTWGEPWLPLAADAEVSNVEAQRNDPHSMLSLVRALLALRRRHEALSVGDYRTIVSQGDLLVYSRDAGAEHLLVVLNLGSGPLAIAAEGIAPGGRVLLSTFLDRQQEPLGEVLSLRPDEGVIVELPEGPAHSGLA